MEWNIVRLLHHTIIRWTLLQNNHNNCKFFAHAKITYSTYKVAIVLCLIDCIFPIETINVIMSRDCMESATSICSRTSGLWVGQSRHPPLPDG